MPENYFLSRLLNNLSHPLLSGNFTKMCQGISFSKFCGNPVTTFCSTTLVCLGYFEFPLLNSRVSERVATLFSQILTAYSGQVEPAREAGLGRHEPVFGHHCRLEPENRRFSARIRRVSRTKRQHGRPATLLRSSGPVARPRPVTRRVVRSAVAKSFIFHGDSGVSARNQKKKKNGGESQGIGYLRTA